MIRDNIEDAIIRTTLITGFPSESEDDIDELEDFIRDIKFNKLGVFAYSQEEGTKAGKMKEQIDEDVKKQRQDRIMNVQYEIANRLNKTYIGKTFTAIVDEVYEDYVVARSYMDVIEVDTVIYVTTDKKHKKGDFIKVIITDTLEYDLKAEEV